MPSIFSEEWRDCLRAHYTYVVRIDDQVTEKTLRGVMFEAGFGEDEVKELYVRATAHVDDVGADFVPDMAIFEEETAPVIAAEPEAAEMVDGEAEPGYDEVEPEFDEAVDMAVEDGEVEPDEEPPPDDEPDETQLSLF